MWHPEEVISPPASRDTEHADFRFLSAICGWLAALVPALTALARTHLWAEWRDDLGVLRGVGLLPIGAEGVVSSSLAQVMLLLPLEGRSLRASLVGVVALGVFGRLVFTFALALLTRQGSPTRLTPLLGLAAALISTLCPVAQSEATTVGGGTVAACLGMATLCLPALWRPGDARLWAAGGALLGLTAAENHAFALALAFALGLHALLHMEFPSQRTSALAFTVFAAALAFCLLPIALRPYSAHAWVNLGLAWGNGASVSSEPAAVAREWLGDVGPVHAGLALVGLGLVAVDTRGRALLLPFGAFLVADLVAPKRGDGLFLPDTLLAARLVGVAAIMVASSVAVQVVTRILSATKLPLMRPASALLVAFTFTLVLINAEDSGRRLDRDAARASEAWTEEALGSLPNGALALVHSPALAWRLWAAQTLSGRRPDVVVVPIHLLGHRSVASSLLRIEPALLATIREISVSGAPSEFSLSALADARPLFVEFDAKWEQALMQHIAPELLWFRFASHTVGRADRKAALTKDDARLARIVRAATTPTARDHATLSVVARHTKTKAAVLADLGDREAALALTKELGHLDPNDPFLDEMTTRLSDETRRDPDLLSLLR